MAAAQVAEAAAQVAEAAVRLAALEQAMGEWRVPVEQAAV
jgi:hypothetical protein